MTRVPKLFVSRDSSELSESSICRKLKDRVTTLMLVWPNSLTQSSILTRQRHSSHLNVMLFGKAESRPKPSPLECEVKMSTREVTRNEWTNFFDIFSKQHEGWIASLEVFDDEVGAQAEAVELPFEGISINSEDQPQSLVINLGR